MLPDDWSELERFAEENGIMFTQREAVHPEVGEPFTVCGFDYPEHWTLEQRREMAEKIHRRFFAEG